MQQGASLAVAAAWGRAEVPEGGVVAVDATGVALELNRPMAWASWHAGDTASGAGDDAAESANEAPQ
jgi:hypothetical protein